MSELISAFARRFAASLALETGAGLVGFVQNLANAVTRSVLDVLRQTVDVADFGAVYGSTADATPAFLKAFTSGKAVRVSGTLRVSTQLVADALTSIVLVADGNGVIEVDASAIGGGSPDDWLRVNVSNTVATFTLRGVKFKGINATVSAPVCQVFNVKNPEVTGCTFENAFMAIKQSTGTRILGNRVSNWKANGSGIITSGKNLVIAHNELKITENLDSDDGIVVNGNSSGFAIIGNTVDKSGATSTYTRNGISVNGSNISGGIVKGNTVRGMVTTVTNSESAIEVNGDNTTTDVIVSMNTIIDCAKGLYTKGAVQRVGLHHNTVNGATVRPIKMDTGTDKFGCSVVGNKVYASALQAVPGIETLNLADGEVSGNTVTNYAKGIYQNGGNKAGITGNTIKGCTNGIETLNTFTPLISGNRLVSCTYGIFWGAQGFGADVTLSGNTFDACTNVHNVETTLRKHWVGNVGVRDMLPVSYANSTTAFTPTDKHTMLTLTANCAISAPPAVDVGDKLRVTFKQGATARTVTFGAEFVLNGYAVPVTANTYSSAEFMCVDKAAPVWVKL